MLTVLCPDSLANDTEPTQAQSRLRASLRFALRAATQSTLATSGHVTPIEHWLAQRFEIPAPYMIGAFRRYFRSPPEHKPDNAITIIPTHLHAGLDHLLLQPPEAIATTENEAAALIDAANEFLMGDAIQLQMIEPQCWLINTPKRLDLNLSSGAMAIGRSVDIYMPAGKDGGTLRSLINELQMLWHDHPVNLARESSGSPKINTVWPEGYAGQFEPALSVDLIVSDNPVTCGLAAAMQVKTATIAQTDLTTLTTKDSLVELNAGADSALEFLDSHRSKRMNLVLSNDEQWVELQTSARDRFCRWRPDPLRL